MDNQERERRAEASVIAARYSGVVRTLPVRFLSTDIAVEGALKSCNPGVVEYTRKVVIEGGKVVYELSQDQFGNLVSITLRKKGDSTELSISKPSLVTSGSDDFMNHLRERYGNVGAQKEFRTRRLEHFNEIMKTVFQRLNQRLNRQDAAGRKPEPGRVRKRGPSPETLKYCKKAMEFWLDDGKSFSAAAKLAGVDRKTVKKWIPNVLKMVDSDTEAKWKKILKAIEKHP